MFFLIPCASGYIATDKPNPEEEVYVVADDIKMHYLLYHNAWQHDSRDYGCILHVRIKNDKIYVEYGGTDVGFADAFADEGIPKKDIVFPNRDYDRNFATNIKHLWRKETSNSLHCAVGA